MPLSSNILECFRLHGIHYNVRNHIVTYCSTLQECHLALSFGMVKELLPPGTSREEIVRQQLFFAPDEHGVSPAETALKEMLEHMRQEVEELLRTRELFPWERCEIRAKQESFCSETPDTITSVCKCGQTMTYPSDSQKACICFQ